MTLLEPAARTGLARPQPIGLFDGPAGLLLVGDADEALLTGLAAGHVPAEWPAGATALARTLAGDVDGALAALGHDPVDHVNRFVLAPTPAHHAAAVAAAVALPGAAVVVAAAAFASGLGDEVPAVGDLTGELAALACATAASASLEYGDRSGAVACLREALGHAAAAGRAFHGRALGALAEHLAQIDGPSDEVLARYDEAIGLLAGTDLDEVRAGLQLQRAMAAHQRAEAEPHRLLEASRLYQSALIVLSEAGHPDSFALANMNLALAILAMPMTQASDQVRLGVAVQSLRAALRVYGRTTHPSEWSAAQLNLANALQYLPSKHQEDNLAEAVTIYEDLLAFRSPDRDPAGYARVLANQANALAHLGVFDHAVPKYTAARSFFVRAGDDAAAAVVDRQLREIELLETSRS